MCIYVYNLRYIACIFRNTMSERNQLNLSKKVYLKLERVRSKNKDKISGLPNRNRIIEYLCDKELEG